MSNELFSNSSTNSATADQTNVGSGDIEAVKQKFTREDGSIDTEALLNKALHADKHISKIESENANLRSEVDKRINYEDMLDKITSTRAQAASNPDNTSPGERAEHPVGITEADIDKRIEERLTRQKLEALHASNEKQVAQELVRVWGRDYVSKLRDRIADLELTEEEAILFSRTKPKAFLALLAPKQVEIPSTSFTPPRSTIAPSTRSDGSTRNYRYYSDIMKKNPNKQYDSDFIDEMHKQAQAMGDAFYN